jgi:hypothetical protein
LLCLSLRNTATTNRRPKGKGTKGMGLRVTLKLATDADAEKAAVALRLLGHEVVVDGCELVASTPKREFVFDTWSNADAARRHADMFGIVWTLQGEPVDNPFDYRPATQWTLTLGRDAA